MRLKDGIDTPDSDDHIMSLIKTPKRRMVEPVMLHLSTKRRGVDTLSVACFVFDPVHSGPDPHQTESSLFFNLVPLKTKSNVWAACQRFDP